MNLTALQIVLSCTNRKRFGSAPTPRLRDIGATDAETRARLWIDRISATEPCSTARDLYAGEYWQAGLNLLATASTYFRTEAWVLSAGLGLVHVDDIIPAYAATLTSGHPDSVVEGVRIGSRAARRTWWAALGAWSGPSEKGRPRRLSDLAATPGVSVLVCAGPDYLEAAAEDLASAYTLLGTERLLILGSKEPPPGLSDSWLRIPGQLRLRLGGSMSSTGVRAARAVVEELAPTGPIHARPAGELVASWLASTDALPRFERKRLSDEEIEDWILADAVEHPDAANRSTALRRLRDEGRACEQARFGRLYDRLMLEAT